MEEQNGKLSSLPRKRYSLIEDDAVLPTNEPLHLTSCGIGSWRPGWLQVFANPVAFLVSISSVAIFQAMAGSLIYSTMSTMEKRYAFDSKIASLIFIADNITSLVLSPIVGYYGPRFNRSRLIGIGQVILGFTCFLSSMPYFIYGPATHLVQESSLSLFASNSTTLNSSALNNNFQMCSTELGAQSEASTCAKHGASNTVWPAVIMLFVANFFRGVGFTIYYVIAMPFMDDNVSKKNSPIFLSVMHSILLIGPLLGFFLSAFCLSLYEDPWNDPGLSRNDPRFVGAWWMAFFIVGCLNLISSVPMFFYPAQFKTASVKATVIKRKMKESGGTIEALMRFARNPLVILYFLGNTFRYFGTGGFYMLLTKYIEAQYRQSSSRASLITGSASITPLSIGIISGGLFISWYRPKTRLLFSLIFLAELTSFFTIGSGILLGCDPIKLQGDRLSPNEAFFLQSQCNQDCHCSTRVYTPLCAPDGSTTYFSPCHAGCTDYNSSDLAFSNCSCFSGVGTKGYCAPDQTCPNLAKYLTMLTIGAFISATAKTGNSLITFRTVEPMDKSFTAGVLTSLVSIFSFIPSPLMFGQIADSACLVWEQKCGKRGNCWLYDQVKFRQRFLGVAITFMALGSVFDFIMIFYADRIKDLYGDEDEKENDENKEKKNDKQIESKPDKEMEFDMKKM